MSSTTLTRPTATEEPRNRATGSVAVQPVTFRRLVSSEIIKLFTVRSTYWILATVVFLWVGYTTLGAFSFQNEQEAMMKGFPLELTTFGIYFAELIVVALAAMTVTSEYGTGMIRSTFTAEPTRLKVLTAKATVVTVVVALISAVTVLIAFGLATLILPAPAVALSLGETIRVLAGVVLYMIVLALFTFAVSVIVRSTPAAISASLGILLVLPLVFSMFASSNSLMTSIYEYLPSVAGQQVYAVTSQPNMLAPWVGVGVFALYTLITSIVAAVVVKKRDV